MAIATRAKRPIARRRRVTSGTLGLLLGGALLGGCGGAVDEALNGPASDPAPSGDASLISARRGGRPADVPPDFVTTPHGYFHPSCVIELDDDERVSDDGATVLRNGREHRALGECQHLRYDRRGAVASKKGAAGTPPTVNGWLASVSSTSAGPVSSISATWRVPRAPTVANTQTLYFFPGLEPAATGDIILQPVLAWNGFFDWRWTIASWNCCKDGNVLHSVPRTVSVGDTITGTVTGSRCSSSGVCSSWSIRTTSSRGSSTTLNTTSYGEVLDWEFGGAFEAYAADGCDEYPPDGGIAFTSVVVRKTNGRLASPTWVPASYGGSPDCLTGVSASAAKVEIAWTTQ